jgi:arylsulfatase
MFSTEGGTRVPLIVRYPGFARQKAIDHSFFTVLDLAPTFYELAGVDLPGAEYQGKPNLPLRGKSLCTYLNDLASQGVHESSYVMGWELAGHAALRKGKWKITFVNRPHGGCCFCLHPCRPQSVDDCPQGPRSGNSTTSKLTQAKRATCLNKTR